MFIYKNRVIVIPYPDSPPGSMNRRIFFIFKVILLSVLGINVKIKS